MVWHALPMTKRLATITAAAALALTGVACGGDDAGGAGSPQAEVANQLIAEAGEDGMSVDEGCVRNVTSDLSDADARALLEDDDDALSFEGGMKLLELFECLDFDFDFDLDDLDFDD